MDLGGVGGSRVKNETHFSETTGGETKEGVATSLSVLSGEKRKVVPGYQPSASDH